MDKALESKLSYQHVCNNKLFVLIIYISNPEKNITFELEKTTYDVVENNSHDYEVIAKVKTNKIEPPPTGTGDFDVNQCPAYVPFPESCKRDENDLTDGVYDIISSL